MEKRLRIIDHWNYKERFKEIKKELPEKNPFFNRNAIAQYIEKAFEVKERPQKRDRFHLP